MNLMPTMRKYDYFFDTHLLARTAFLNCHKDLCNVFVKTVIKDTFAFDCFTRAIGPFVSNLYIQREIQCKVTFHSSDN